jgi:hypothetical protein
VVLPTTVAGRGRNATGEHGRNEGLVALHYFSEYVVERPENAYSLGVVGIFEFLHFFLMAFRAVSGTDDDGDINAVMFEGVLVSLLGFMISIVTYVSTKIFAITSLFIDAGGLLFVTFDTDFSFSGHFRQGVGLPGFKL